MDDYLLPNRASELSGFGESLPTEAQGNDIPPAVLDLLRWLAGCCMLQQRKRHEAIALPPEECREFVSMRWPIVQGLRNQMALEEIGRQSVNKDNLNEAIEWLLAHPPAAVDELRRARGEKEGEAS